MKKLLVLLSLVVITLPAISQVNFGLKVGASTTSITMDEATKITSSGGAEYLLNEAAGASYGFHGGGFVRINIGKLYIQPELLFATRSNEYTLSKVNSMVDSIRCETDCQ